MNIKPTNISSTEFNLFNLRNGTAAPKPVSRNRKSQCWENCQPKHCCCCMEQIKVRKWLPLESFYSIHLFFKWYFVSLLPLINGARFIQIRCKKHNMLHVFVTHFPAIFKKSKHDIEFLMIILNCGDLKRYLIVPCDLSLIRHLTWSFNHIL